jgi:hypothetical protein
MAWRYAHSIPPGYKDKGKADDGIGDLLVWKTLLQIGRERKSDCIFVTEDAKGDWWVQSEGVFQPRIELVEEYRQASEGRTIHLVPLSSFLQLFGAEDNVVDEAKQAEVARRIKQQMVNDQLRQLEALGAQALADEKPPEPARNDRQELMRRSAQLKARSMEIAREVSRLNRTLHDAEVIEALDEREIANLFQAREQFEDERRRLFLERRDIDNYLKQQYLGS